jgi:hypothetical protein
VVITRDGDFSPVNGRLRLSADQHRVSAQVSILLAP